MPKEVTHWLIAHATADDLRKKSEWSEWFATEFTPEAAYLGASFHDVLYYVPQKKGFRPFSDIADCLHGSRGEDTLDIVRLLIRECIEHPANNALRSFLLGVITHICADIAFHPFIYWASGNWHGKGLFAAQRHHRALESLIDLHFCGFLDLGGHCPSWNQWSLSDFYSATEAPLTEILPMLVRQPYFDHWRDLGDIQLVHVVQRGYRNLATARWWCENRFANRLMAPLESYLSPRMQTFIALRYGYEMQQPLRDMANALHYEHPITGEAHNATLEEMFQKAVQTSATLFAQIQYAIALQRPAHLTEQGLSLEVGLAHTPATAMTHFAAEPFPMLYHSTLIRP